MAVEQEYEITLKWKDEDYFEMSCKKNNDPVVKVVRIEENGRMETIWPGTQSSAITFINDILNDIGKEMMSHSS